MTNGEVNESLLVSQASKLIAETITEIEKLREGCADRSVYPHGIGNISIRIKNGDKAVELDVGSPPEILPPPKPLQAKHTMIMTYKIVPQGNGPNPSMATQLVDTTTSLPIEFKLDGKEHQVTILV